MTKKDRWLTAVAFAASALPIILMAFTLKILPNYIPLIDFNSTDSQDAYMSKYNNLITIIFYLIPLTVVLVARYIKSKIKDFGNYKAIQCVAIVLSLSFATINLLGFLEQIRVSDELKSLDVVGLAAVCTALFIAILGTLIRYRKYNSFFAINNKFTRSAPSVWKTVHKTAGTVQVAVFVMLAMLLAFARGGVAWIFLGVALVAYFGWVTIYSYAVKVIYDSRHLTMKANEVTIDK